MSNRNVNRESLIREHQAIGAQIRSITQSLTDSMGKCMPGAKQPSMGKDQLQACLWSLENLRDSLILHMEMDERIIETLKPGKKAQNLLKEHESIMAEIEKAIETTAAALENKAKQEEIARLMSAVCEATGKISDLLKSHTAREDSLFL